MNQKSSIELLIQRDRLWIALGLVTAIVLAWFYLLREAAAMNAMAAEARRHAATGMAGLNMRAWDASDWFALFAMWSVMMVGMMLPSAAPVIMLVLGAYRLRRLQVAGKQLAGIRNQESGIRSQESGIRLVVKVD